MADKKKGKKLPPWLKTEEDSQKISPKGKKKGKKPAMGKGKC